MADRARYPDGTVALRLEPFSDEQVRAWVGIWNRTNERHFADTGTLPLPDTLAEHHRELAVQPLLLLMLALYDATGNALQRGDTPLNEADLYEDLLVAFAAREVGKSAAAEPPAEVAFLVRQELERLSLVAFAMLNRRRQWVTASELGDDLDALLGRLAAESRFRGPLGHGDIALGRFFFIQRAQAVQDGHRLATYEFLHATFGEYLAVRLAVDLFRRLIHQQPTLIVGPAPLVQDASGAAQVAHQLARRDGEDGAARGPGSAGRHRRGRAAGNAPPAGTDHEQVVRPVGEPDERGRGFALAVTSRSRTPGGSPSKASLNTCLSRSPAASSSAASTGGAGEVPVPLDSRLRSHPFTARVARGPLSSSNRKSSSISTGIRSGINGWPPRPHVCQPSLAK